MEKKTPMTLTHVRLPSSYEEALKRIAEHEDIPYAVAYRKIVKLGIERYEQTDSFKQG